MKPPTPLNNQAPISHSTFATFYPNDWDEEAYQQQDDIDREEETKPRKRRAPFTPKEEKPYKGLYLLRNEWKKLLKAMEADTSLLAWDRLVGKEIIKKWIVKGECWLTDEQLSKVGCSKDTVSQIIKTLKKKQWIRTKKYHNYDDTKRPRRFYWTRKITMGKTALKIAGFYDEEK